MCFLSFFAKLVWMYAYEILRCCVFMFPHYSFMFFRFPYMFTAVHNMSWCVRCAFYFSSFVFSAIFDLSWHVSFPSILATNPHHPPESQTPLENDRRFGVKACSYSMSTPVVICPHPSCMFGICSCPRFGFLFSDFFLSWCVCFLLCFLLYSISRNCTVPNGQHVHTNYSTIPTNPRQSNKSKESKDSPRLLRPNKNKGAKASLES